VPVAALGVFKSTQETRERVALTFDVLKTADAGSAHA
jgi:hypothetical protein